MVWQRCCVRRGEGGSEGREFADPLSTVLAREVVPRVRSKKKGDLLKGCECGAGKGIVSKEVGEGRDYGVALGGAVGAGKDHVEFVTEGVGGAVRAVAKLVGDVPEGDWGEELVGREGAALASHGRRRGMGASEGRRRR
jgi:hypothetical protein